MPISGFEVGRCLLDWGRDGRAKKFLGMRDLTMTEPKGRFWLGAGPSCINKGGSDIPPPRAYFVSTEWPCMCPTGLGVCRHSDAGIWGQGSTFAEIRLIDNGDRGASELDGICHRIGAINPHVLVGRLPAGLGVCGVVHLRTQ
jgi:hypothetical protein